MVKSTTRNGNFIFYPVTRDVANIKTEKQMKKSCSTSNSYIKFNEFVDLNKSWREYEINRQQMAWGYDNGKDIV